VHRGGDVEQVREERSGWEKVADSPLAKAAAVVVIAIAALWTYATWNPPERHDSPLQVATAFEGIQLGQKLSALPARLGPFDKEAPRPDVMRKYKDEVDYQQRNGSLRVGVRDGVVHSIGYFCNAGKDGTTLNNVACHDAETRVRKVFGGSLRVLCARVKPGDPDKDLALHVRAYDAIAYGTRYVLIKDEVQGFIIMDVKELDSLVGLNWVRCG
jgi:hypothetical protein